MENALNIPEDLGSCLAFFWFPGLAGKFFVFIAGSVEWWGQPAEAAPRMKICSRLSQAVIGPVE